MANNEPGLSIVLFPQPQGDEPIIDRLDECLLSLSAQCCQFLHIVVLLLREKSPEPEQIRNLVELQPWMPPPQVQFVEVEPAEPPHLLHSGIKAITSQFFAFLAYDNVAFEQGYSAAIEVMQEQGTRFALGDLRLARRHSEHGTRYIIQKTKLTPEMSGINTHQDLLSGKTYPLEGCVFRHDRQVLAPLMDDSMSGVDLISHYASLGKFSRVHKTICELPHSTVQLGM